jgi:prolipoprotein diacylglyceryltransferase
MDFFGSVLGGIVGFFLGYYFVLRRQRITVWQMADIVAPCVALGLALGRVGCLLNGCCYGKVACPDCPAIHFPFSAPPRAALVVNGYQSLGGLVADASDNRRVARVEADSPAARAGVKAGDLIVAVNGMKTQTLLELHDALNKDWPRGENALVLTVRRAGATDGRPEEVTLPAFAPWTLGLHPTQVYETVSMLLLLGVLLAYWPFRRREGELLVLVMLGYGVHRFVNELLRDDTPARWFGVTLEQTYSVALIVGGLALAVWLWFRPAQFRLVNDVSADEAAESARQPGPATAVKPAAGY